MFYLQNYLINKRCYIYIVFFFFASSLQESDAIKGNFYTKLGIVFWHKCFYKRKMFNTVLYKNETRRI